MILGKISFLLFLFLLNFSIIASAEDKIAITPLVNLENLKPSFEKEDTENKDVLTYENINLKKKKYYAIKNQKNKSQHCCSR